MIHQLFEIPLSNQKKADENCRKIKVTQIIVFLQSSSAFFKIPPSNQRKADENCRKVKVTQTMVFLQSSSAFYQNYP